MPIILKYLEPFRWNSRKALESSKSGIGSIVQNIRSLQMLNKQIMSISEKSNQECKERLILAMSSIWIDISAFAEHHFYQQVPTQYMDQLCRADCIIKME